MATCSLSTKSGCYLCDITLTKHNPLQKTKVKSDQGTHVILHMFSRFQPSPVTKASTRGATGKGPKVETMSSSITLGRLLHFSVYELGRHSPGFAMDPKRSKNKFGGLLKLQEAAWEN